MFFARTLNRQEFLFKELPDLTGIRITPQGSFLFSLESQPLWQNYFNYTYYPRKLKKPTTAKALTLFKKDFDPNKPIVKPSEHLTDQLVKRANILIEKRFKKKWNNENAQEWHRIINALNDRKKIGISVPELKELLDNYDFIMEYEADEKDNDDLLDF